MGFIKNKNKNKDKIILFDDCNDNKVEDDEEVYNNDKDKGRTDNLVELTEIVNGGKMNSIDLLQNLHDAIMSDKSGNDHINNTQRNFGEVLHNFGADIESDSDGLESGEGIINKQISIIAQNIPLQVISPQNS